MRLLVRLQDVGMTLADVDLGGIDAEADRKLDEYFVTTPYVTTALRGRRTLFLGRKGSGKSALFSQLPRLTAAKGQVGPTVISITPDQYAWAALKRYQEQGILPEQAHTNAWKLTLVLEIAARLASLERGWDSETSPAIESLRKFVEENYGTTQPGFLQTATSVLKGLKQFNFSAFGFGVGLQRDLESQPMTPTVVQALLGVLERPLAAKGVLVALDRLDDSWDGSDDSQSLMIGLLKAAKELNDRFEWHDGARGLRILVFLRTDIYDALRFDDKDKHRPTEEHITWKPEELKTMLQRRLPPDVAVDELFEPGDMRGSISPFNYIVKRTFLRPREVLQFVSECIRQAGTQAVQVTKDSIRAAEERYSGWKVSDLKQEYAKVFPKYDALLECLRQERHRYDAIDELQRLLERKQPELVAEYGARNLLEILFDSSVIGVRLGDAGSARFKSEDSELTLPMFGAVYVHQSLHRGLKIREARKAVVDEQEAQARSQHARITIELQKLMMAALPVQDMTWFGLKPTPGAIFRNSDFQTFAESLGLKLVEDDTFTTLRRPDKIPAGRLTEDKAVYERLRQQMGDLLATNQVTWQQYVDREGDPRGA
jgi:hypothetical protein